MLISPGAVEACTSLLAPDSFYRTSNATIYQAIADMFSRGEPVDVLTVIDSLEQFGKLEKVGGSHRLQELAALVPSAANASHYARIVRDNATLRALIATGEKMSRLGWDRPGEADALIETAEQYVYDLSVGRERGEFSYPAQTVPVAFQRIQELSENGQPVVDLPCGFTALDRITSGLAPGNLIVIAARPSMGKTALALGIVNHVATHLTRPVAIFTLEQTKQEVTQRLLSIEGFVEQQQIRNGTLRGKEDWDKLVRAAALVERAPIAIHDTPAVTLGEIRSKARKLKTRTPDLALIVIDYLQLLTSGVTEASRVQEVSTISRSLKVLAGELQVPVIALSQLSRQVEQRHDKRPLLSDLRESGSIEQDADLVWFIYRDDYYSDESINPGVAEVNVAKNRNGPTDTVFLTFVKRYARFSDIIGPQP